jgi:hypothetical protein
MTDLINSAPLAIRHLLLPRVKFPKLGFGSTIVSVSTSITQAYCMAYVKPFDTLRRRPSIPNDFDLEGRNPNW